MKRLMIKSTVYVGFQLAILSACASENLQTTGLEPNPTVAPGQPNTPAVTPSQTPTTPAMEAPTNEGSNGEGNPAAMLPTTGLNPPATNPNAPPAAMPGGNMETDTETEEPPPETEVVLTPSQIGGQLEGFLHLAPCESQDFGHDCTLPQCVGGSKTLEQTIQLGGEVGTIYDVTIHVYGVVEPRVYQGGVRRAGANFNVNALDFWHVGGTVPANPGTYNSYEMHVNPPVAGEANTYFLNSRTGGDQTWVIRLDYEATIAVPGGGTIRWRSFDLNCRQITNCDDAECGPLTPKPVTVAAVQGANPPPPATFVQPYNTGANVGRGQWVYIDVTNAVARP